MSNKRKHKAFIREIEPYMKSIDDLKLTWMKLLPYKGGRFGGWVSENYLAMSRIMKWFYSILDRLASDKAPWVEPVDKPQDMWSAVDNKNWLQQRGLYAQGLAKPVRERVQHYMNQVPAPAVVEMTAGPVEDVLLTISSLDELISLVMIEEIPNEEYYAVLERKIRIFLTHFADMEDQMPRGKKQMPQWLSAYNFLSLLNLPDVVRRYGPIRNVWEGGAQGEGVLRFVKPNVKNGMRRAWELATMKTLMRKKAMEYVVDQTVGTGESRRSRNNDTKAYHPYTDILAIDPMLRNNKKVISSVLLDDGRWGIIWKKGNVNYFLALVISEEIHACSFGLNYHIWHRDLGQGDEILRELSIVKAGLLLPLQQYKLDEDDAEYVSNCYALTSEDHRTLDRYGESNFA
jgi:hypothetical protein